MPLPRYNYSKPTELGQGVSTNTRIGNYVHPNQRYKSNEALLKSLNLPSIAKSTEEIAIDPFRSEGFDAFMQEKLDVVGAKNKAQEEAKLAKEKFKKEMADAKLKAEEEEAFLDSPKGRLQTLWADADKRDAILGGITDAMTEVKFGQDAYQSRFHDTQKRFDKT
tara:strand:- start:470 stop:964 length:495 start_codon:yes stop_codon:yes gene_type:complete